MVPVGSTATRDAITTYKPLLGLHGHIHESRGGCATSPGGYQSATQAASTAKGGSWAACSSISRNDGAS